MKKILHILYSGLGGHGSVVFSYLEEPLTFETENYLLFFGVEEINPEFEKICREKSFDYMFVKKKNGLNFKYISEILSILKSQNPDLIITHSLPTVPLAIAYSLFKKTETILVEHTSLPQKRNSDYIYSVLGLMFFDKIIFLTKKNYKDAASKFRYLFKPEKIQIIPNGIDLKKFKPDRSKSGDELIVATHCRITEIKDLPILIKAFALLKSENNIRARLKIAGDGADLENLRKLAKSLAIIENIDFTGLLSEDEVVNFLQSSDIYVNTSKLESMSTSVMQAMACGLPCVVSSIAGNLELIENNRTGLTFQVGNSKDLAEKNFQLLFDENLRLKLGNNAAEVSKSRFSNRMMTENYNNLIK